MTVENLPILLGSADTDGLNQALNAIVHDLQTAKDLASLLEKHPRAVIRRTLRLNRYQYGWLSEMSEERLRELVAPVVTGLRGPNVLNARLEFGERLETHSPFECTCTLHFKS
jgi:hypothetical protein